MSTYRNYIREAAGFDGTTSEPLDNYKKIGSYVYTSGDISGTGLFSPLSVGRSNVASLARIMLQGTVNPITDYFAVVDSIGQERFTVPASIVTSGWLFLGPEDLIKIVSLGATKVDILIEDLDDESLIEYILADVQGGGIVPSAFPLQEIVVQVSQTIPAYSNGHLVVFIENVAAVNLVLPSITDLDNGSLITFIRRNGDVAVDVKVTTGDGAIEVNGQLGINETEYYLRSYGDSITYLKLTDGYQHEFGEQAPEQIASAAAVINVPSFTGGTFFVEDSGVLAGNQLVLPLLSTFKQGTKIVHRNSDTLVHRIVPTGPDTINGLTQLLVSAGATTEINAGKSEWIATGSDAFAISTQTVVADATLALTGTHLFVDCSSAVAITVTLPSTAVNTHKLGSKITLFRSSGVGIPRIIAANALDVVNGQAGIVATEWFLYSTNSSVTYTAVAGGWTRDQDYAQPQFQTISGPGIIPSVNGELVVSFDAVVDSTIVLPALTSVAIGSRILVFKADNIGNCLINADNAADLINGVAAAGGNARRLTGVCSSVAYVRCSGGWWCSVDGNYIPETDGADIVAKENTGFYQMTGNAAQLLTLPALTLVNPGTAITVFNNSLFEHTIVPSGVNLINGVNNSVKDEPSDRTTFISFGSTLGWISQSTPSRQISTFVSTIVSATGLVAYIPSQVTGTITSISVISEKATVTGSATFTCAINGVAITTGVVTVPTTDAAGAINTVAPTANRLCFIGDIISVTVGGTNTTDCGAYVSMRVSVQSEQ